MRELFEHENAEGYELELRERLAAAGCDVARRALASEPELDQVEDEDEDELEDEDEDELGELLTVLEPAHALYVALRLELRELELGRRRRE